MELYCKCGHPRKAHKQFDWGDGTFEPYCEGTVVNPKCPADDECPCRAFVEDLWLSSEKAGR